MTRLFRWGRWLPVIALLLTGFLAGSASARRETKAKVQQHDSAQSQLVEQVLSVIKQNYVDSLGDADLARLAAEGIVSRLKDPYSALLDQRGYERSSRPSVQPASTTVRVLADSIALVSIPSVSKGSADALRATITGLRATGLRGLVLDLRGNPGGLVAEGVAIAGLFLDQDLPIGRLEGHRYSQRFVARENQQWPDLPLVVLVDKRTASAAELIAGTLQEHDRAAIVGSRTFGNGLAQTPFTLKDGLVLKLTTARWVTARGRVLDANPANVGTYTSDSGRLLRDARGVSPDFEFPDANPEAALDAAIRMLQNSRSVTDLFTQQTELSAK